MAKIMIKIMLALVILCMLGCIGAYLDFKLIKIHRDFVYCKMIQTGMSRTEVHEILELFGKYRVDNKPYEELGIKEIREWIVFENPIVWHFIGRRVFLVYDQEYTLKYRGYSPIILDDLLLGSHNNLLPCFSSSSF